MEETQTQRKQTVAQRNPALARLRLDYMELKKEPLPFILAEPEPSNILTW
jgi:hypothetical protein